MRYLYIGLGFVFFGLATVGAVIPVLPTTPFLLLSSFFFIKSSRKLYAWFITTKLYKKYLESYVKERAMTLKTKLALLSLTTSMLALAFVMVDNVFARIAMGVALVAKLWYFTFKIKTIKPDEQTAP